MSKKPFDFLIRGGTVGTAADVFEADIAVRDGRIVAIGHDLGEAAQELDATGRLVLPGGVDTHVHIEQLSANGLMSADDWESGTAAAAFGGTTSVIAFAAQHKGWNLARVVEDYSGLAERGAIIDYAFHLIVADPTPETLEKDLPDLLARGYGSIKLFTTYDLLQVGDAQILDILRIARRHGASVCFHAENHGMIAWETQRLLSEGLTAPRYHADSHPRAAEVEAIERVIRMSELVDQPVVIFHVSTQEAAEAVRAARARGVRVSAETCPHYLLLTRDELDRPGLEGGKWMCSPPLRLAGDHEALWRALESRDIQLVTSDHAAYRFDETAKLRHGPSSTFKQIANGMPGIEVRLPLLFDAMVSSGRFGVERFVEATATAPARLFGLHPQKGTIAIGADADLVLWDPERKVTLGAAMLHDRTGYTPFEGREVTGWPHTVMRRGQIVVRDGALAAAPGSGRFVPLVRTPERTPSL